MLSIRTSVNCCRCWRRESVSYFSLQKLPTVVCCILALVSVIRGLLVAALSWMLALWCSLWSVFMETRSSRWILRFVVICCCSYLDTVLLSAWWSFTFRFCPLFFFTDKVLPCFAYAVIIVKNVVLKTPGLRLHTLLLNGLPSQFLEIPSQVRLLLLAGVDSFLCLLTNCDLIIWDVNSSAIVKSRQHHIGS